MTTTLRRPIPVDQETEASGPASPPQSPAVIDDPTLLASLALMTLTLVVAVGLGRLFADGSYIVPVAAAAVGCHTVAWVSRRLSLGFGVSTLLGIAVPALVISWLVVPETTFFGIPTASTLSTTSHALSTAYEAFRHVVAPAPVTDGFVIASVIGVAVAALLADAAAFTVRATFESAIPSFTLFVFTATLGTARFRTLSVAAYLGALLLFLMLHQEALDSLSASWFASRTRAGRGGLLRIGGLLTAIAVTAAVVAGPHLPGAGARAIIRWRGGEGEGHTTRTTVSPLVNIRTRLVDRANVEVFTVRSPVRAYWRLTSLDRFDGEIWSSEGSYEKLGNTLKNDVPSTGDAVTQQFAVSQLSSIWLPSAYEPRHVDGVEALSYNPDSASIISKLPTSDGLLYQVDSVVPHFSAAQLAAAPVGGLSAKALRQYTAPPNVSARIRALALQVAGAGTPFERAKKLQDFLRSPRFTYDLRVPAGHDGRALERFLFEVRRGYCEQFAGSYAVLARIVGLPTRVAVGFTAGELNRDGLYHVRDLNAHAWPEVFLSGFGWVAFEPTPGRGAPGAQDYTGVAESQASPTNPATATTLGATATTEAPQPPDQQQTPTSAPGQNQQQAAPTPTPVRHSSHTLVLGLLAAMLVIALYGAAVPTAKHLRRSRRRAAARDAAGRVLVSWAEASEALGAARVPRRPAETMSEFATRASTQVPLPDQPAGALTTLAEDAAAASYGPDAPPAEAVVRAERAASSVEAALRARTTTMKRVLRAIDPRPLLRSSATRRQR